MIDETELLQFDFGQTGGVPLSSTVRPDLRNHFVFSTIGDHSGLDNPMLDSNGLINYIIVWMGLVSQAHNPLGIIQSELMNLITTDRPAKIYQRDFAIRNVAIKLHYFGYRYAVKIFHALENALFV